MKKILIILILFFSCHLVFSQEMNKLSNPELSVDFGSLRNRYLYPINDLNFSSALLKNSNFKYSVRLRSYGTLYFLSKSAYDITPIAEYYPTKTYKPIYFSICAGVDARLRLVHDQRSDATSSVEPIISFALHSKIKNLSLSMPLWTRFYSNGISFEVLPELSYKLNKRISLFARYELTYMAIYGASSQELRRDCFIGIKVLI